MGAISRRATKWERPEAIDSLNEFGRRVRETWLRSDLGIQEFSQSAGLSLKGIDSILRRETVENLESKTSVSSAVKIARAGGVSLVWLAAGVGDMLTGQFAPDDNIGMAEMPESLARATHAAMAITGCTRAQALAAAEVALSRPTPVGGRSVDEWLALVRALINLADHESGERPSVRVLAKK